MVSLLLESKEVSVETMDFYGIFLVFLLNFFLVVAVNKKEL